VKKVPAKKAAPPSGPTAVEQAPESDTRS